MTKKSIKLKTSSEVKEFALSEINYLLKYAKNEIKEWNKFIVKLEKDKKDYEK